MEPLVALSADASVDLSPLTRKLWAERVPHRVVFDGQGQQLLLLANPQDIHRVQHWLELWRDGQIEDAPVNSPVKENRASLLLGLLTAPISAITLLILIAMFGWMHLSNDWQDWLITGYYYWPDRRNDIGTYFSLGLWELWRPVLLHFSLMHIVFNGLWWWILAPKIERIDGVLPLLTLIFLGGLVGNVVQWWYMGPAFGGASGITMAFLGWVGIRLKRTHYDFPRAMLPIMVGMMVLMIAADTLVPGLTGTAHGAHLGGLLAGLALGALWPVASRTQK